MSESKPWLQLEVAVFRCVLLMGMAALSGLALAGCNSSESTAPHLADCKKHSYDALINELSNYLTILDALPPETSGDLRSLVVNAVESRFLMLARNAASPEAIPVTRAECAFVRAVHRLQRDGVVLVPARADLLLEGDLELAENYIGTRCQQGDVEPTLGSTESLTP